jgi:Porin PorA
MRKAAIASGAIGLILLVAAGLMAWWITPSYIARVPSNYNKTRTYTGTIQTVVNPAALATGNLSAAIKTGLPATLTDHVRALQTSGNSVLMQDTRTITTPGSTVARTVNNYSLNRQNLMATAPHPSNWSVTPATGITVSWPLGAKQHDYTGWVYLTQTTTRLRYVRQASQGGINTYVYQANVPPTQIRNGQVLAPLPHALPVALLTRISGAGIISPADVAALAKAFPGATSVPLRYTYRGANTYYVAPSTGLVINVSTNETEEANIALPTGQLIPLIPVLADTYHATPGSLSAAVTDANNGSSTITTWGVTVPIIAACVGFLLVVFAVILWLRGRSRGRPVDVSEGQRHPSPVGSIS